jgi:integrase
MKLRKPRLWLRDIPGAEKNQAYYLVWYDEEGHEKKRSLTAQINGQPFPKHNPRLREICRVQAERILTNASVEIAKGNMERLERQVGIQQPTFSELFATWALKETVRGKAVTLKQSNVDGWTLSRKRAGRITDDNIYDFFEYLEDELELSRRYALRCLRDVRVCFDFAKLRGYCTENPAANVKPKRKPQNHRRNDDRYLTKGEVQQLLATDVKEPWVRKYWLLTLHLACGIAELGYLKWDMIQEVDGRELLVMPRAKNASLTIARWVDDLGDLLPPQSGDFIFPDIPHTEKELTTLRNRFNRWLKLWSADACLERDGSPFHVTSYMARRTAATAINNSVQDPLLAARAIGHVNTQHTHRYTRHDDEQRANSGRMGMQFLGLS